MSTAILSRQVPNGSVREFVSNRDADQTHFEEELLGELGDLACIQNEQDVSVLGDRVPTFPQLQRELEKLSRDPAIPFEYISGGCSSRAHVMCEAMQKDHINCGKMFAMVDRPGQLTAKNKYMEGGWWYHVAPLSFAEDPQSHAVEPFILDPSIADHLLRPSEWVRAMWDARTNLRIDITRAAQLGPIESDGLSPSFEAGLPAARQELALHAAELRALKQAG